MVHVPIIIYFLAPPLVIKILLFDLHTVDHTNCTLWAVLCLSKCCLYLFVTCHLWLVIVTGSEPDVAVSRHVGGSDSDLGESEG